MPDIILKRNLSEGTVALNIAMRGVVDTDETESVMGEVYWRFEDEPDSPKQFLGEQTVGHTLAVPFDPKGRPIRLYIKGRTETGVESARNFNEMEQVVFDPGAKLDAAEGSIEAAEDLDAGDMVNIFDDSGTTKARKADASDNTKPCNGFVAESYSSLGGFGLGEQARVFFVGNVNSHKTSLTIGVPYFLSETAGGITATPPSGTGKIVQRVGFAISTTEMEFEPHEPIKLR
jgi:hypothetical protein